MDADGPLSSIPSDRPARFRTNALRWLSLVALALLGFTSSAARSIGHADDTEDMLVVVHPRSRINVLSAQQLEAIYTRSTTRWDDGALIIPFNLADTSPLRHRFDRTVLRLDPQQVGRFWLDQRIRGLGAPPKQVPDVALLVKVIERLPGSIGYAPMSRVRPGVKIVARIRNGGVVAP